MKYPYMVAITITIVFIVSAGIYLEKAAMHSSSTNVLRNDTANSNAYNLSTNPRTPLNNLGRAPEFTGITNWINSDALTLAQLKGKVVLVDFWTYSCINCIRTLPYVTRWFDTYKDKGFVVVGVHTPEFGFEKDSDNVRDAAARFGIYYPIAQDNNYATWSAYDNKYWPAEYLIDQNGNIVYTHFGEGNYDRTENTIRQLLGLHTDAKDIVNANLHDVGSPEMYFGTDRLQNLSSSQSPSAKAITYTLPLRLELNQFALGGNWQFTPDHISLVSGTGIIRLKFHAGKVHMVASSATPAQLSITVDGKIQPMITVDESQLYTLFDSTDYTDHLIDISVDTPEFTAFTFTFG